LLAGINAASLLVLSKGTPDDAGSLPKRAARAALAIQLYFAAYGILEGILEITGLGSVEFVEDSVDCAFEVFACTFGAVALDRKLKLYEGDVIETKDLACRSV
jgi:hypothetical protein